MLNHFVRDIESVRVFDESPAWFTSARIPADINVRVEVRDNPVPSILRLDCDSLEKKVHCGHKTLLSTGATVLDQTFPVAVVDYSQFLKLNKNREWTTHSRVRVETRVLLS